MPSRFSLLQPSPGRQPYFTSEGDAASSDATSSVQPLQQPSSTDSGISQLYRHASAGHNILTWPAIQQLLLQALPSNIGDLRSLEAEGLAFIVRMQQGMPGLPLDEVLLCRPVVGMQMRETRIAGGASVTFPDLDYWTMHRLTMAYFDTFNFMYPFMNQQDFISNSLARVQSEGFNSEIDSVIALLVFALGELATEGSHGRPIDVYRGRPSGLRGGSVERPPGLALFNEARKRMGFVLTACELENIQIYALTGCVAPFDHVGWT